MAFVDIVAQLLSVHGALTKAGLPHAFGGAIALAYCTEEPRGTRDLDVNIFVDASNARKVLAALPQEISIDEDDVIACERQGQRRLWLAGTPVDVFLNNVPFHERAAQGVVWVPLADVSIPVLDALSLVVFKAVFNRSKDWVDIDAVAAVDTAAIREACDAVAEMVGRDDERFVKLAAIADDPGAYRRPGPNARFTDPG